VPPASPRASRWPLFLGLGLVLAALVGGAWVLRGSLPGGPAATPPPPAPVSLLAQRAIDSQVELARRKLEAGEYADAVRQAEGALKLDPQNVPARKVLDEAEATLRRIDAAVGAVREAGTERDRLARAALDLMTLDPGHPEAEKAATAAGSAFRPRADEARRLEQQARRAAEEAGAGQLSSFDEGVALERQGDQALASGYAVTAARRFLEARNRFERAQRTPR
jgi:tetratricopeptide (TPR) repeat protein